MSEQSLFSKIERGIAEKAYEFVKSAKGRLGGKEKDYKSLVRKIPQMIMSGGLGQSIAFLYSKKSGNEVHKLLYEQFEDYFKSNIVAIRLDQSNIELIQWIISLDSYGYSIATWELLSLVKWLKRFAEGMIEG
ncbi:MAG: type III-B CRISPR module-associated protein Cmr5 [Spirochaetia bacterium]|nr:type III-B CRISPR module-associated protein Cmr5 [Spirochaetota bacterium]MDW8113258.1 type III-B CRISPR module-associated protein Cmr5 [Spirochaetia bacterium]